MEDGMTATCRAFVGIALPPAYQQALAIIRERLRPLAPPDMRWTRPGNWHLTLQFLGDVPLAGPGGLDEVKAALAGVRFEPFVLAGAGGGSFPDAKRPRVVWLGLAAGGQACVRLAAAVAAALSPLGFPAEDRPFAAHLTLARIRAPDRVGDLAPMLQALSEVRLPETPVRDITLWRSVLAPSGPRYAVLATVPAVVG